MIVDVIPHLLQRPVDNRVDLYQTKLCIPLDLVSRRSKGCLIPADAGNPGGQFLQLAAERFRFAQAAAEIGIARP